MHLPAAAWGAYIEFSGTYCPLTPLENHFSRLAGEEGYAGGFIEHYLIPVIYPAGLTAYVQTLLGLFVIAVNLVVYAFVLRRAFNRPGGNDLFTCRREKQDRQADNEHLRKSPYSFTSKTCLC